MFATMAETPEQIEAALMKIPGVKATRVVLGDNGKPAEVHIVASGEKPAKQLVRDVQTVALATLGLEIDHRIVSVVQFPDSAPAPLGDKRITIDEITTETKGTNSQVRVILTWRNVSSSGEASGFTSAEGLLRLAAQATLEAVRGLLADGAWLALDHVSVHRVGSRDIALATLSVGPGGVALSGSAVVMGQHTEAIVRAVLDAVNRRLTPSEREAQRPRN
jgi:hypothetical protein